MTECLFKKKAQTAKQVRACKLPKDSSKLFRPRTTFKLEHFCICHQSGAEKLRRSSSLKSPLKLEGPVKVISRSDAHLYSCKASLSAVHNVFISIVLYTRVYTFHFVPEAAINMLKMAKARTCTAFNLINHRPHFSCFCYFIRVSNSSVTCSCSVLYLFAGYGARRDGFYD